MKTNQLMIANDSKSDLHYLNNKVNQYSNTYHDYIKKNPINADYSTLIGNIETNLKASKFKVNDRVTITKHKSIFSKVYTENWSREIFIINSVLKNHPWT